VPILTSGSHYNVDRFRRDKHDIRIRRWERDEVGDVKGKTLLHVQCHFGLDTLSWARLGANVTGIDFSDAAIEFARKLASDAGLDKVSRFLVAGVYDLPDVLAPETFDVVYTSRGAIGWLPDIDRWGEIVASLVKPGGTFYIHDAHPLLWVVDDKQGSPNDLRLSHDYWSPVVNLVTGDGSLEEGSTVNLESAEDWERGWNHSIGEVVTALASNGLRIEFLYEKRTVAWPIDWLVEVAPGQYGFPPDQDGTIPLMFSLRARKEGLLHLPQSS
jgi:SAM-dependent methyltransferase